MYVCVCVLWDHYLCVCVCLRVCALKYKILFVFVALCVVTFLMTRFSLFVLMMTGGCGKTTLMFHVSCAVRLTDRQYTINIPPHPLSRSLHLSLSASFKLIFSLSLCAVRVAKQRGTSACNRHHSPWRSVRAAPRWG